MTFSPGQTFVGRYRLERIVGQGGMGVVWLARDMELERDVALKFLPEIVVNDLASLNDLKRETKRSLELTHPNIVRTYDFVMDDMAAAISMEYVENNSLRHRRFEQPNGVFQPLQLAEWVVQLCEALDYAHRMAAIVHRDLKPANLMIDSRRRLKVADFGLSASLMESATHVSGLASAAGTLVYMSPQQLAGEQPSPADDIYAVGATLFELLTSRPPFYSGNITGQISEKVAPSIKKRRAELGIPCAELAYNRGPEIKERVGRSVRQQKIGSRRGGQTRWKNSLQPSGGPRISHVPSEIRHG